MRWALGGGLVYCFCCCEEGADEVMNNDYVSNEGEDCVRGDY